MASLEQQQDAPNETGTKNKTENGTSSEPRPKPKPKSKAWQWIEGRADATWKNLQTNHLWQRMLKNTLATTIATIIALLPPVVAVYGKATYLACITTVFGHPGRRFGQMAEALVLTILGTTLGTAWSTLGLYLSSLVYETNAPAAYTIKGIFLVIALMVHGFLRSHTPRLFIMVLLMIIVSVVSLTGTNNVVTATLITTLMYPILTAAGLLLLVNLCIFPEFSSSFLGITTIETLGETVGAVRDAGTYFISISSPSETPIEQKAKEDDSPNEPRTAAEPPETREASKSFPSIHDLIKAVFRSKNNGREEKSKPRSEPKKVERIKLKSLTDQKPQLRAKLDSCKAAQQECNFELAFSVLPPRDLKPVSDTAMNKLVANTVALIGACESKYALVGDDGDDEDQETSDLVEEASSDHETSRRQSSVDESSEDEMEKQQNEEKKLNKLSKKKKGKNKLQREIEELELVKPEKEIKFGDPELLRALIQRVSRPIVELQDKIDKIVDVVTSCLAYCFDVSRLPDGSRPPQGIKLEEIDIWSDIFAAAIAEFDKDSASCLEGAAALQDLDNSQIDIMPRMETFLISSFLLNLRQAALHTQEMLAHSRKLVELRQFRHDRRRIYAPRINWRKWLSSGGEEDMLALPSKGRKDARSGTGKESVEHDHSAESSVDNLLKKQIDEEAAIDKSESLPSSRLDNPKAPAEKPKKEKGTIENRVRNKLADIVEYLSASDDVLYAFKLTIAVMLVTWPAFVSNWNTWYSLNRGLWAALQLVLITEVAIGTSVNVFILRALGTTFGCVWGYAAFQAGDDNRVICVVILAIGVIPSTYVQLGTKYIKAGMVSIVSMCVVALATEDQTVPGTATENFLKRLLAFLIGAVVALIVECTLFPVKARDRLVESLAASIRQISEMEACLAYGIESEANVDVHSPEVSERFDNAKSKAQTALTAAETFLPFCAQEPRLKGSFAGLSLVYSEILYVLHQIVDKMDNMLQLRKEYGSGVLEELNAQVYPYRRNVAGSITLILFAVHEALTTKLPLPQFLPSARLAHLRMVNRVREVILSKTQRPSIGPNFDVGSHHESTRSQLELSLVKRIVRQKFLSWNAASAGQTEVIEFLEELIELVKLLVGANEFRSGMLTRPTYREYIGHIDEKNQEKNDKSKDAPRKSAHKTEKEMEQDELRDIVPVTHKLGLGKRRSPKQSSDQIGNVLSQAKSENSKELERRKKSNDEELPRSLQRVRSRRIEEQTDMMVKLKSKEKYEGLWMK